MFGVEQTIHALHKENIFSTQFYATVMQDIGKFKNDPTSRVVNSIYDTYLGQKVSKQDLIEKLIVAKKTSHEKRIEIIVE